MATQPILEDLLLFHQFRIHVPLHLLENPLVLHVLGLKVTLMLLLNSLEHLQPAHLMDR